MVIVNKRVIRSVDFIWKEKEVLNYEIILINLNFKKGNDLLIVYIDFVLWFYCLIL